MILPPIFEFGTVTVADSGVPNQERIAFRPTEPVNLAQCGILLALRRDGGLVTPIQNEFFWFGEIEVAPPSWVLVFTGKGEFQISRHASTGHTVYSFHWGKSQTVFNYQDIVPVLFRMGGINIGGHLKALPALPASFLEALKLRPKA